MWNKLHRCDWFKSTSLAGELEQLPRDVHTHYSDFDKLMSLPDVNAPPRDLDSSSQII